MDNSDMNWLTYDSYNQPKREDAQATTLEVYSASAFRYELYIAKVSGGIYRIANGMPFLW